MKNTINNPNLSPNKLVIKLVIRSRHPNDPIIYIEPRAVNWQFGGDAALMILNSPDTPKHVESGLMQITFLPTN